MSKLPILVKDDGVDGGDVMDNGVDSNERLETGVIGVVRHTFLASVFALGGNTDFGLKYVTGVNPCPKTNH